MIKQWIRAGNDWIAVNDQNKACYILTPLNDESIVQRLKVSEIGSQHAREPCENRSGIPEALQHLGRRSTNSIFKLKKSMDKIEEYNEKQRNNSVN